MNAMAFLMLDSSYILELYFLQHWADEKYTHASTNHGYFFKAYIRE
jgi:hypothetical protein